MTMKIKCDGCGTTVEADVLPDDWDTSTMSVPYGKEFTVTVCPRCTKNPPARLFTLGAARQGG